MSDFVFSSFFRYYPPLAGVSQHAETNPRTARGGEKVRVAKSRQMPRKLSPSRLSCRLAVKQQTLGGLPTAAMKCANLGTPSRSAHGPDYPACRQRSHGYLRQSVRTARPRKHSFRTGGRCDLTHRMRARRRCWQIRVRAGATCEVRWARSNLNRVMHSHEPAAAFTHE